MTIWKDETSYHQGERGHIVPKTWKARSGRLCVTVTRHLNYPGDWCLVCYEAGIHIQQLNVDGNASPEVAQADALKIVRRKLIKLMDDLAIIEPAATTTHSES